MTEHKRKGDRERRCGGRRESFEKLSLLPPRPHPPFKTFHQGKRKTGKQEAAVPRRGAEAPSPQRKKPGTARESRGKSDGCGRAGTTTALPCRYQRSRKWPPRPGRAWPCGKAAAWRRPALSGVAKAQIRGLSPKAHGKGAGEQDRPPSFRPDAGPGIHKEARAGEPGNTSVKDGHRPLKKNGTEGHPARGKRLFCAVFLRRVGTKVRPGGTRRQNAPGRRTEKGAKNGHHARLRRHVRSCATGLSAIRSSRRRQATKA